MTHDIENDPAGLDAEITRRREELAQTVDVLNGKLDVTGPDEATPADVKEHAQGMVARVRDAATTDAGRPRPSVALGVGGIASGLVVLLWCRRRS